MTTPKTDRVTLSVPLRSFDKQQFAKDAFNSEIDPKHFYKKYKHLRLPGVTFVDLEKLRRTHVQFHATFWKEPNSWDVFQEALLQLHELTGDCKLSRIDIKVDFESEDVEDLIHKKFFNKKYFGKFEDKKTVKPFVIGTPIETGYFKHRHFKIRIYNKVLEIQERLNEGKRIHPVEIEILREFGDSFYTRFEAEIRGGFTDVANELLFTTTKENEFTQTVFNRFLRQNPLRSGKKKLHPLWERLIAGKEINVVRGNFKKKSGNRTKDLQKTAAFLRNKFDKWGYSPKESLEYLTQALGLAPARAVGDSGGAEAA